MPNNRILARRTVIEDWPSRIFRRFFYLDQISLTLAGSLGNIPRLREVALLTTPVIQ